jgi:hypothetical protein
VNTYTANNQLYPSVTIDRAGDFLVTWTSYGQVADSWGVYSQAYRAGGFPDGGEFRVNTYTSGGQSYQLPARGVAMDAAGDAVVNWESFGQDGSSYGVYAQRYKLSEPPQVSGVQINDGSAQRSRVTNLTVTFNSQVSFATTPGAAFTLTRNSDSAAVSFSATANVVNGVTVVTLNNFTGSATDFGSLADGRYTLTALASQITTPGGQLDGNGDGIGGDDYDLASAATPNPPTNIFRLYGDINGDGSVSASDLIAFRQYFGGMNFAFDFDGDGSISASDFIQFRLRFGGSI